MVGVTRVTDTSTKPRETRPRSRSCGRIATTWLIGNRKTDIGRLRADGGRDADDAAIRIDERPAAVAKTDRGVRLNVRIERLVE
jgi:hypothetical protein